MKRSISNQFLENLKNGALHVIVDHVRVDPYLDLELRGNCVMVYYRGGKILTVYENQNLEGLAEEYYLRENEHRLALFCIIVVAYVINGGYAIHNIKFIDVGKQFPYAFKRVRMSLYE